MSVLTETFTEQLYANYEANAKYLALENAITHNGLLKSLETRQSEIDNDFVFSIDLTRIRSLIKRLQVVAGCLQP